MNLLLCMLTTFKLGTFLKAEYTFVIFVVPPFSDICFHFISQCDMLSIILLMNYLRMNTKCLAIV